MFDADRFNEYVQGHQQSLAKYGGEFLVAAGEFEVVEGEWSPRLLAVVNWSDRAAFRAWYDSEDYRPWRETRHSCSSANVVVVDGIGSVE